MMKKLLLKIFMIGLALAFAGTICFAADAKNLAQTDQEQYININKASKNLLVTLPGLNDLFAQKIIDNRPYKNKEELKAKKIIPTDLYEKIKNRIITRDPT